MPRKKTLVRPWTTRWATILVLAPTAFLFHDWMISTGLVSLSALFDLVLDHFFANTSGPFLTDHAGSTGKEAPHEPGSPPAPKWVWPVGAMLLLAWVFCSVTLKSPGSTPFGQRFFWFVYAGLPPLMAFGSRMTARWLFRWRSRREPLSVGDVFDWMPTDTSELAILVLLGLLFPPIIGNPGSRYPPVLLILCTVFYAGIHAMTSYGLAVHPEPFGTGGLPVFLGLTIMLILAASGWVSLPEHKLLPACRPRRETSKKRASRKP